MLTKLKGYGGDDPSYADINTKDPSSILDQSKSVVIRLDEYRTLLRTYDEYSIASLHLDPPEFWW